MKDFKENFNLKDWKVHVLCLVIMVIAELIGTQKISITGPGLVWPFLGPLLYVSVPGRRCSGIRTNGT